jgi:hypothetical protein
LDREKPALVLMAVDPYLVYAYWRGVHGAHEPDSQATLRFRDMSDQSSFDVDVDLGARGWYVRLWSPERTYVAELGFRRADGAFLALASSNVVGTPPAWPRRKAAEAATLVAPDVPRPAKRRKAAANVELASPPAAAEAVFEPEIPAPALSEVEPAELEALSDEAFVPASSPDADLTGLSESKYTSGVPSSGARPRRAPD